MSGYVGLENKGWFFLFYMSSTIVIRLFASSLSDKIGRRKALMIGLFFMALSMVILGFSKDWIQYTIGATVFGISTGISSPTIFAWMADLSPEKRRGVGSGTVFIALELAIMFGALITLTIYDNSVVTIPICYSIGALFSIIGMTYLFWHLRYRDSIT
jgi:MFS family permease